MLEVTLDNCYKCDLETIIDPNNSQYFWINRRDLEIESKRVAGKLFSIALEQKLEFLKLKEKLGLCLYHEQEFISTSEEIFKEEKFLTQHDVENNQLKEENEQLKVENEQLRKENEQLRKNNVVKDATIKESIEKLAEIKSPKED